MANELALQGYRQLALWSRGVDIELLKTAR